LLSSISGGAGGPRNSAVTGQAGYPGEIKIW
jgi:hypothetical protein